MSDDPVQYLIHPALRPSLDAWLESRGMRVDPLPAEMQSPDQLVTYLVAPADPPTEVWTPPTDPESDPVRRTSW